MANFNGVPDLVLKYPKLVDQVISNQILADGYLNNPMYGDPEKYEMSSTHKETVNFRDPVGTFSKRVIGSNTFPNDPAYESKEIYWLINYSPGYIGSYESLTDAKNVVFKDYGLSEYLTYHKVIPIYDAVLSLYDENEDIISSHNLLANQVFIIDESIRESVRSLTVDYGDLLIESGDSVSISITTLVKDMAQTPSDRNLFNRGSVTSTLVMGDRELEYIKDSSAYIRFYEVERKINATKTQTFSNNILGSGQEGSYTIGFQARTYMKGTNTTAANSLEVTLINGFRQVDLLPKDLRIKDIVLSETFLDYGGSYRTEALDDGRTMIEFTAPNLPSDANWIARIDVIISGTSHTGSTFNNVTYIDYDNEDIFPLNTKYYEEEGKYLTTAEVTFNLIKNSWVGIFKEIREEGAHWTDHIITDAGDNIEYKIILNNEIDNAIPNIQILDIFPYPDDRLMVENEDGVRLPRKSELSNQFIEVKSISLINIEDNSRTDISGLMPIKYLNVSPDNITGSIDDWLDGLSDSQLSSSMGSDVKGIVVGDGSYKLEGNRRIEIIISMKAPITEKWRSNLVNTVAWRSKDYSNYIEASPVTNTIREPVRDVKIKKVDEKGNPLSGAEFTLKKGGILVERKESNLNGEVIYRDLKFESGYTIEETRAPVGFEASDDVYEVPENQDSMDVLYTFINEELPPIEYDKEFAFIVKKYGADGNPLKGVGFRLSDRRTGEVVASKFSGADGIVRFEGLYNGQYILEEIIAPGNYTKIEPKLITINEGTANEEREVYAHIVNDSFDLEIIKIGLRNLVSDPTELEKTDGKRLEGVIFQLWNSQGELVKDQLSTNSSGRIKLDGLKANELYTLKEISGHPNYEPGEEVVFKLDIEGRPLNSQGKPYKSGSIIVQNMEPKKPSSIVINKKDYDTNENLKGAIFKLEVFKDKKWNLVIEKETNDQGIVSFDNLFGGIYQVSEVKAPKGYIADKKAEIVVLEDYVSRTVSLDYYNKALELSLDKVEVLSDNPDNLGEIQELYPEAFVAEGLVYRNIEMGQVYTLVETSAPEGYELRETLVVDTSKHFSYASPSKPFYVRNSKILGSVNISKYSDEDGKILPGAVFGLFRQGELLYEATTNSNGSASFKGLEPGEYLVKETQAPLDRELDDREYPVEISKEHRNIILSFYNKLNLVDISGEKTWVDGDNQDGIRPAEITVKLLGNGELVREITVSPDADGKWSYSFIGLRKELNGQDIIYEIDEKEVEGYEISRSGLDLINTHIPATKDIEALKQWDDGDDQDLLRPGYVEVELYKNGEATGQIRKLEELNQWREAWTDLPVYEAGQKIVYTVKELTELDGYEAAIEENEEGSLFTIINSHRPETIEIPVTKTWDDADNQDGLRPDTITVKLLADGEELEVVTISSDDGWTHSFTGLPRYKGGVEIVYNIEEVEVEGYETLIDGFDIINTHRPETIEIPVTKTWDDADNQDGLRPDTITVKLLADGKVLEVVTISSKNGWTHSFTGLPRYKNGVEIIYSIEEDKVEGYETLIDGFDITNTKIPEKPVEPEKPKPEGKTPLPSTGSKGATNLVFAGFVFLLIALALIRKQFLNITKKLAKVIRL